MAYVWRLSIYSLVAPWLVSWDRGKLCQVFVARTWLVVLYWCVLQMACIASCFLRDTERWKSEDLILSTSLMTDFSTVGRKSQITLRSPVISISLGPLWNTWQRSNFHQIPLWRNLSVSAYRHLTPIYSGSGYKPWCHSDTNSKFAVVTTWGLMFRRQPRAMCYIQVRIKFLM